MDIELKRGRALIIAGPQGSGKTRLAEEIAAKYGLCIQIDLTTFLSVSALNDVLRARPATLIVDGFPSTEKALNRVKEVITSPQMTVHIKFGPPIAITTPHLIFCSGNTHLWSEYEGRRFHIVTLPADQQNTASRCRDLQRTHED